MVPCSFLFLFWELFAFLYYNSSARLLPIAKAIDFFPEDDLSL
jgi:hypothetical protein